MSSIHSIIQTGIDALAGVTPRTLTADHIKSARETLDGIDINDAIDRYWRTLPAKPDNEDLVPASEKEMREKGDEINHALHQLKHELDRIKSIKQTLSLDYLEPLIKSAQHIIRPLYNFTAQLNS
jgi:hypothetical protein